MSRRSQLVLLLVVSALLHAALFALLARSPPAARTRPAPRAIEMEIVTRDARPAPTPAAPEPRTPPTPVKPSRRAEHPRPSSPTAPVEQAPGPRPEEPALAEEASPSAPDVPLATAPTPGLDLAPRGLLGGGLLRGPPSTGRTLRNVPGEAPDPKALAARQAEEARQRVDGWARDAVATARASGGAVDPYFVKLRKGFEAQLVDPPSPDAKAVLSRIQREQAEAHARFGHTGSPTAAEPRDFRIEAGNRIQAAVEAGRASNMSMMDVTAPVLALAAIVEVRQARDGKLIDLKVLEGSGDAKFDTWAVSQLRDALARADAPGKAGPGSHEDGMASRWRLEEYLGNPRVRIRLLAVY
ncbi:ferrichrome ABC transporter substrate-binding protein [Corallococcus sp. CA053C]|uniref:ferrichrome ABC transporter substrate-binding protein n=1 Tax=Corallococcus sp. CA053C TaxID=2316732 RepID=UPI0018F50E62|nr:ferrichrome ABC transporter substrate-binding protein [Corallococcus sp. CA053C]